MENLIIKFQDVSKTLGSRKVLSIPNLTVYENDRIGIIGKNGVGKSTLLKLISKELLPDTGHIQNQVDFTYYQQVANLNSDDPKLDGGLLSRFNVPQVGRHDLSGGEAAKYRLTQTLSNYSPGILLDEPTTHIDSSGVEILIEELRYYYATLLFVSHDRYFLDQLATKIWEISDGKIIEYPGNYSNYLQLKKAETIEQERKFENYQRDKQQLTESLAKKQAQVSRMSKVSAKQRKRNIKPDRYSSSKQKDTVQKNFQKTAKVLEGKLTRLESVSMPEKETKIRFTLPKSLLMHNPYPVMAEELTIKRGNKSILKDTSFQFPNGQKIAITGENAIGKTTLLNYIQESGAGITLSPKVKFSSYQQFAYQLKSDLSLLRFIEKRSDYQEPIIRSVLHNLDFTYQQALEPVKKLSGGEATKIALALVFLRPANVLILDEPTSFIDLNTVIALQKFIKDYPGMVIFTSHDRYFVESVATKIYQMKDNKVKLIKD
ncbi:ribosomal protection-like ABC-F family protein [Companilactobacillus furfuricola]|uniref:ribosomal protection-like ABC-F family protein n=1 Tax=Companilactobacillus furfuricola TaxID=1462575 RepID=UPI000F76EE21|nr:ABC-F type ribosomal protection protein [Companilactobacillus furfuricola]